MSLDLDRMVTWLAFGAFFVMLGFYLTEVWHSARLADMFQESLDALNMCLESGHGRLSVLEDALQSALGRSTQD